MKHPHTPFLIGLSFYYYDNRIRMWVFRKLTPEKADKVRSILAEMDAVHNQKIDCGMMQISRDVFAKHERMVSYRDSG
jgi:hypothetical protein